MQAMGVCGFWSGEASRQAGRQHGGGVLTMGGMFNDL